MKKLLSLLLPLALLLSLAACGEKSADEAARQTPPTLTVTSANACSVTLKSSSYDWTYTQGLQSMTAIACGAHPLDETSRDITPVLEMPFAVSAAYFYTVTLDFGDNSPDSVSLRCWPSDAWGSTVMPPETVTAQRQDNGTFRAELPQSDGIFAVDALWDGSSATYTFCTQAEGSEELHPGAVLSIGESEDIRKIDISWRSGSVNIYAAEQSAQISVKEESAAPRPTRPRSWCSADRPNRSAFSMTMTVAFGTSTPTSMTVVETSTSSSPALNLCMTSSFSFGFSLPCSRPMRRLGSSAQAVSV